MLLQSHVLSLCRRLLTAYAKEGPSEICFLLQADPLSITHKSRDALPTSSHPPRHHTAPLSQFGQSVDTFPAEPILFMLEINKVLWDGF